MLIIPQKVEVTLSSNTIGYYENLGYVIPRYKNKDNNYRLTVKHGTKIFVNIEDLQKGTQIKVLVKCDYCGIDYYKNFNSYNKSRKDIVDKDCCDNCKPLKIIESNNIIYGSKSSVTAESIKKRSETRRTNFEQIKQEFSNVNFTLLIKEDEFINSNIPLACVCNNHPNIIQYKSRKHVKNGFGCKLCDNENRRGEGNFLWKGGISPLHNYLRAHILQWKKDSINNCNNKCVLTGEKSNIVHHLYGFDLILQDLIDKLSLDIDDFNNIKTNNIEPEKLKQIEDKCLELHYKYGLGVCLSKPIHKLFHQQYGYGSNTPSQFTEFQQHYNNGEFTPLLSAK